MAFSNNPWFQTKKHFSDLNILVGSLGDTGDNFFLNEYIVYLFELQCKHWVLITNNSLNKH